MSDSLRPHGLLTVQGILQARILEWVAFPFSRGSSQPRDQTQVSHIAGGFFTSWATGEAQLSNQGRYLIIKSTMKHSQLFLLVCESHIKRHQFPSEGKEVKYM